MAKFFKIPFAATGDKVAIPDAVQPDGSVSYAQGFGVDYQRKTDGSDPLAKNIPRDKTNSLYNDITAAIGEIQLNGAAEWQAAGSPYPINAMVRSINKNWKSSIDNNNSTPSSNSDWIEIESTTSGRLINIQTFTTPGTFTYSPTAGTKSVIVEVQGGGGAGGGVGAAAAGQISIAPGGNAGAYAKSRITAGFSGASIVVGSGGGGRTGLSGLSGGASSFGGLVTAPGGPGGILYAGSSLQAVININSAVQTIASGGNIINASGGHGAPAMASQGAGGGSGNGGDSLFGAGAVGVPVVSGSFFNGSSSSCAGAAGSGASSTNGTGPAGGGNGATGIVIVWEYT